VVEAKLHAFLTSALDEDVWLVSHTTYFTPLETGTPGTWWIKRLGGFQSWRVNM
jgi:hypothetical protein